jgi:ABC-type branched-subunit amino acid transport system substrate-binding protein
LGAQKLIYDQSVNFILGTLTIGDALSVSKLAETTKTILITPVTSSQIFSPGLRYTFKVGPTDVDICKASAIYVSEVSKYKKIAFITSNINYLMITTNLQKQFFTKQGLKVVFEETVQWDQKNFYEILTKIKNSKADILYTNLDSIRLGLVLKQIRELGLDIQTIDSAILSSYKDVFNIAGSKIEGHLSIGYPDYKKLGYNSTHLIYDALKKAGTYKRVEEIRKVMITGTRELGGFYDWGGPRRVSVEIVKFTADGDKELIKDIVFDVPPDPPWGKN